MVVREMEFRVQIFLQSTSLSVVVVLLQVLLILHCELYWLDQHLVQVEADENHRH